VTHDLAFTSATVILPNRLLANATVYCRAGRIQSVGRGVRVPRSVERVDCGGQYLAPGFVDLHVHGGGGVDFMDGTVDAVCGACRSHLRHGTTTIFPTTTTGQHDEIQQMLSACAAAKRLPLSPIAGVHLYGPYFAPDKVGCHAPTGCRPPEASEYLPYFQTGMIRIATCAAELPGSEAFYREARRRRCLVTCGHSNASYQEMVQAHRTGVRHVDHFWCAMSSIASLRARHGFPLQASMAEFVLQHPSMSTEVIADGIHLSDELLEFARVMLGPERLCLVTDSSRALDMPPGTYRFGHPQTGTSFVSDGKMARASDGGPASSICGMDQMVRHFHRHTRAPLWEAVRIASLTPAQRTGIHRQVGSIEQGKWANVLLLDQELAVQRVFLRGNEVTNLA